MTRQTSTTTLDEASSTFDESDPLREAGKDAGESVGHLGERATELGLQQADRGKEQAAQGIGQVADSMRRVSMDMQGEQPAIANVAMTAADQAERVATYLRDTDAREILDTVEQAARRQPLIFLGGAFLLGLAASRLLKAGGSDSSKQMSAGYRSGYATSYGSGLSGDYRATGPSGRNGLDELPSEGI